ncbi:MAG TPA: ATPase [Opitutae bacterium]|nr:ATPase [Opitutae bacterium]
MKGSFLLREKGKLKFSYLHTMRIFLLVSLLFLSIPSFGQGKAAEVSFAVEGVCGMCETRIEKAFDLPGILNADWDLATTELTIAYKRKKFTEKQLWQIAANAGHDTDLIKASDEAYAGLHGCCKYREEGAGGC